MDDIVLRMEGIGKRFGPVTALSGVSLTVRRGSVHALIGENGAGKSTLMNVLGGVVRPDEGRVVFEGRPLAVSSPGEALRRGIAMIHQELSIAPHLTVAENMVLGRERSFCGIVRRDDRAVRAALENLGCGGIRPDTPARDLGVGDRQMVEIARALSADARLIVMDEPTSALSEEGKEALFRAVARLKARGIAVVYISHFLEEVFAAADAYTVLRDGACAVSGALAGTDPDTLVRHMVGRPLAEVFPRVPHEPGETALEVRRLRAGRRVRDVSFSLRRGEILGVAGLVGAGRTEAFRALVGLDRAGGGDLSFAGGPSIPAARMTPPAALAMGIGMLSENRKDEGLAVGLPVRENVTLSSLRRFARGRTGLLDLRREARAVESLRDRLAVRCRSILQPVRDLSGGNQQKVAFARIAADESAVLLLDEPTRGVDVGSKAEIYRLMGEFAAQGKAVVFASSYLPELFGVADRIAVMHRGVLGPARPTAGWTRESVIREAASGAAAGEGAA